MLMWDISVMFCIRAEINFSSCVICIDSYYGSTTRHFLISLYLCVVIFFSFNRCYSGLGCSFCLQSSILVKLSYQLLAFVVWYIILSFLKLFHKCRWYMEKNQARNLDLNRTRTLVHVLIMSQGAVRRPSLSPDQAQVQPQVLIGK